MSDFGKHLAFRVSAVNVSGGKNENDMSREEKADGTGGRQTGGCPDAANLRGELLAAIRELNAINTQLIQALIDGDPDFARFDLLLHMATERKDHAKYALIGHLDTHRCEEI
ncbi:MAG: hypothetical protein M3N54_02295 [Acidobacteriota bacterium]|nr:hypothetical protein [Acidobacteriota bacterium]